MIVAALLGTHLAREAKRARAAGPDLLVNARWRASSAYRIYLAPAMFFHTDEEASPALTFELPVPREVSELVVINTETFRERSVPLVAEVSIDGREYHEVARTDAVFARWRPRFQRQFARFLRLRVLKRTWLHLREVHAYR